MDFTKLNVEFANMQNTITKYNGLITEIKNRIRNNSRDISKYEIKIKNTKNKIEKDMLNLYITILKNENEFMGGLINECNDKIEKNV